MKTAMAALAWASLWTYSPDATSPTTAEQGCALQSANPSETSENTSGVIFIPALHEVRVAIAEPVSSKTAVTGACIAITLADPIIIDGSEVIPAGAKGLGQVVHAAKARAGGKGGELILAARFIEHDGVMVPLRSFQFSKAGKDELDIALAASSALPMAGYLFSGGNVWVEPGMTGTAKVRHAVYMVQPAADHRDNVPIQKGKSGE